MIRSVELSTKFANKGKNNTLSDFLCEYKRVLILFIDLFWGTDNYKFAKTEDIKLIESWLNVRAKQCAAKQALGIINGTFKKHKQRQYRKNILIKEGKSTKCLDKFKTPTKPTIGNISAELDSRFVEINTSKNSFELWITIKGFGKHKVIIPLKKTKVFNKWCNGKRKTGCRLTDHSIIVYFESEPKVNRNTQVIGVDIGMTNCLSLSNGKQISKCPHDHTLSSISKRLSSRKKGSKGFKRTQTHRTNFINWSINQLNKFNIKTLVIEDLKNIRKCKRTSRFLSHFTYADILRKLELFCEEWNVSIVKVNPAYTSQTCNKCGNIKTNNRKGVKFKCSCGYTADADINAAQNILASV